MLDRNFGVLALVAVLAMAATSAEAFDDAKYPDWGGQWRRPRGLATQWDPTRPPGLAQKPPDLRYFKPAGR